MIDPIAVCVDLCNRESAEGHAPYVRGHFVGSTTGPLASALLHLVERLQRQLPARNFYDIVGGSADLTTVPFPRAETPLADVLAHLDVPFEDKTAPLPEAVCLNLAKRILGTDTMFLNYERTLLALVTELLDTPDLPQRTRDFLMPPSAEQVLDRKAHEWLEKRYRDKGQEGPAESVRSRKYALSSHIADQLAAYKAGILDA